MPRLFLVLLLSVSGCAVMHTVTGDEMFRPAPPPVVRGPNVPEPEPVDDLAEPPSHRAVVEDDLPPLPAAKAEKPAKKKSTDVAKR